MSRQIEALIVNADDMASMFGDLERLRNSDFARKWHSFPTTKEDIQATLKEIGVDGVEHKQYYITDYETSVPALREHLPPGADIDEINHLAMRMEVVEKGYGLETFTAVMESGRHCESLSDIINVTENMDCFYLQPSYSAEMYGEFLAMMAQDEFGGMIEKLEHSSDPDMRELAAYITRLEKHFDSEAYGRELVQSENGVFTPSGYLTEINPGEYVDVYSGRHDVEYPVFAFPEPATRDRPSVMEKLAAAKESVKAREDGGPSLEKPGKSHDAEL